MDARGPTDAELVDGARRGTMVESVERTQTAGLMLVLRAAGPNNPADDLGWCCPDQRGTMSDRSPPPESAPHGPGDAAGHLWPSPDYHRQVERLRAAVGETIYLVELAVTEVQLGIRLTGQPYCLLGVLDFPRPDPTKGLAAHLILLDDGRGLNLGRIARITCNRPFSPTPADILFQDERALQELLFRDRQLSAGFIAQRAKALLGELLGADHRPPEARLSGPAAGDHPPTEP